MKWIIILSLLITGCGSEINKFEVNKAQDYCKSRGGIFMYDTKIFMNTVKCNDIDKHIMISKLSSPPEGDADDER